MKKDISCPNNLIITPVKLFKSVAGVEAGHSTIIREEEDLVIDEGPVPLPMGVMKKRNYLTLIIRHESPSGSMLKPVKPYKLHD